MIKAGKNHNPDYCLPFFIGFRFFSTHPSHSGSPLSSCASFPMVNLREDFHLQDVGHAGQRKKKETELPFCLFFIRYRITGNLFCCWCCRCFCCWCCCSWCCRCFCCWCCWCCWSGRCCCWSFYRCFYRCFSFFCAAHERN